MKSLSEARTLQALQVRVRSLAPDRVALWGTLTAPRMVCHLCDQLRVALGETQAKPVDTLLRRTLAKWVILYAGLPTPKGKVPTVPEMLETRPGIWEKDLRTCCTLLARVGTESPAGRHPAFGPMNAREWSRLAYLHADHHLRQFGV